MQADILMTYRCKRCAATFHGRQQLQPHLHWHYITDTNVEEHFTEEAGEKDRPASQAPAASAPPRRSAPSYGVLWVCLAILAVLAIAYYMAN